MAANPGGQQVGQISIRVRPNTARFGEELKAQLQKLERTLKVELPVEVDTASVSREVKTAAQRAADEVVRLRSELETSGIVRAARRIKALAQKATGAIKLTAKLNLKQSLARIRAQVKVIQKYAKAYKIRFPVEWAGLTKLLALAGVASGAMLGLNNVVLALGGALKAVGGIALTLPAAFVAAGTGIAVLVVGMRGFFDTLKNAGDAKAFEESLKKLAPSAQESARALAKFREPLKEIQQATQQALFDGLADSFAKIQSLLLPLRTGMIGVATGLRDMARGFLNMATSEQSVKDLDSIMRGTSKAFQNASPAAASFGQALRDIAAVGAGFLPGMGTAVANIANKFRDFISAARESGDLGRWIQNGIDSFRKFGQVISNVWGVFSNIGTAMRGGDGLLDMLVKVTGQAKELSGSAQGQAAWKSLAAVMREVFAVARAVFTEAFNQAADILRDLTPFLVEFAKQLGGALVAALKIVGPLLQSFARFLSENRAIMAPLLVAITGLVTAFKLFSTVANGINAVRNSWLAMKAAADIAYVSTVKFGQGLKTVIVWLAQTTAALVRTIVQFAVFTARAIWSATVTAAIWIAEITRMVAVTVAGWVRMAASATANAAVVAATWLANATRIAATWIAQTAVMAATAIANWVRMAVSAAVQAGIIAATWITQGAAMAASWIGNILRIAAVTVANFVRMAAVALAQAARMAASWFIAMGPVGWVIGIVVALVALIIANWDKVKAFTVSAWNAISNAVVNAINSIVNWFHGLGSKINSALGGLPGQLWNAGVAAIRGFINGIGSMIGSVVNKVKSVVSAVRDFFPFSPAKRGPFSGKGYTIHSGRALMEDWAKGVEQKAPGAMRTIQGLMESANSAASAEWHGTMSRDDFGIAGSVRDGVLAGFNGARLSVDGSGVAKLVNTVNQKNARR